MPSLPPSRLIGAAFVSLTFAQAAVGQAPPAAGPKQVGVMTAATEAVALTVTSPGRAVARDEVSIRPRVDGVVSEVLYTPGQPIKTGAPMFKIEPATYDAAVAEAQADLASAKAAVTEADAAYQRTSALQRSAATPAQLDTAQATLDQAKATVASAEAALGLAQTRLGWTTVTSPLDGLPSVSEVTAGDLVTSGQADALATVTSLDPIDVDVYEPSARLQRIRDRVESGQINLNQTIGAHLTLENGVTYAATGELVAPGFNVSTSTGAIDFRFRFQNPEQRILPGMFVRSTVDLGTIDAVLVPQLAATRGRDGTLTAWVAEDGKAVSRQLTEEGVKDNAWIVTGGLADGDLLIVNGTTGLNAGAEVQTVAATVDENGVVTDVASTTPDTPAAPAADASTTAPAAAQPAAN